MKKTTRYNSSPNAIRPWQHVLEPLSGYLKLAQALYESPLEFSGSWNFGPNEHDAKPVSWIINEMVGAWPGASWQLDQSVTNPHEANYLKLDVSKAKHNLSWQPIWSLNRTLSHILAWHQAWLSGADMRKQSLNEISEYMQAMSGRENG